MNPETLQVPLTPAAEPSLLGAGALDLLLEGGAVRLIRFHGVEVLRAIDCPIRDEDWGTLPVVEIGMSADQLPDGFRHERRFRTDDGAIEGRFRLEARASRSEARLVADVALTALRPVRVNRAGLVLLHPIAGVAGTAVTVAHPDGSTDLARFPERISPVQPVRDIAGLAHEVRGLSVSIAMEGETFEMEDQRNWSDASFKTYCRPLALPRPYPIAAGEVVRQRVTLAVTGGAPATMPATAGPIRAVAPLVTLAHEPDLGGRVAPHLGRLGIDALLLRLSSRAGPADFRLPFPAPVALEIVLEPDHAPGDAFAALARAASAAGVAPIRVTALPRPYLASYQPEGPWPAGPRPADLVLPLRAAFPAASIGGGMLTNFTEFNRHPPDPTPLDFTTFSVTPLVHAADDRSVLQTLEAHVDLYSSAAALAGGKPLHLGLVSIGMRSNPYGANVAPNPQGLRVAMAISDPRQRCLFAAAWAVAAAASAARSGVASLALAMTGGPLGLAEPQAEIWRLSPLFHALRALAALGGPVTVAGGPSEGLVTLTGPGRDGIGGIVANLGPGPARIELVQPVLSLAAPALPKAASDPDWTLRPGTAGPVTLAPFELAILKEGGS